MLKKKNVIGWLLLAGLIIGASRLYSPTSKEEKETKENSPGLPKDSPGRGNNRDTGWRGWPIIEQFIELKRKVALDELRDLYIVFFATILLASFAAVISFEIKRFADFVGIFVLYLATLMLALPPERTSEEDDKTLRDKQRRHIRIALGFVAFGTGMQMSSFHLSGKEANDKTEARIRQFEETARSTETRLKSLEEENAAQAYALAQARSEIQTMKEVTEHGRVMKRPALRGVSRSVHTK